MLTSLLQRFPLFKGLLDFAFPPLCSGCRAFADDSGNICENCQAAIDWFEDPFVLTDSGFVPVRLERDWLGKHLFPLFAGGNYADPLKEIVTSFKFRGATASFSLLAERVAGIHGERISKLNATALVPIPLHPSREYRRAYNQATLFALEISRLLSIPVDDDLLYRVKRRKPQAKLSEAERVRNIRNVFSVNQEKDQTGADRLILVDDVVTSGQTILEAKRTLEQVGYEAVAAISVAHGV